MAEDIIDTIGGHGLLDILGAEGQRDMMRAYARTVEQCKAASYQYGGDSEVTIRVKFRLIVDTKQGNRLGITVLQPKHKRPGPPPAEVEMRATPVTAEDGEHVVGVHVQPCLPGFAGISPTPSGAKIELKN